MPSPDLFPNVLLFAVVVVVVFLVVLVFFGESEVKRG